MRSQTSPCLHIWSRETYSEYKGDEGYFGAGATPIAVGDHLYTVNQDGDAKVVDITGRKGKVVGGGKFGESVLGTPAVGAGAMFVRSAGHLWKIAVK